MANGNDRLTAAFMTLRHLFILGCLLPDHLTGLDYATV